MSVVPGEDEIFRKIDEINCFANITKNLSPSGYKFQIDKKNNVMNI